MTAPEIERQERLQVTAADGTTHRFYTHDEVQAAIAAAMMGAVKPLEWAALGTGRWIATDALFGGVAGAKLRFSLPDLTFKGGKFALTIFPTPALWSSGDQ